MRRLGGWLLLAAGGWLALPSAAAGQHATADTRPVHRVSRSDTPIHVDGHLDEAAWQRASRVAVNIEVQPGENVPAPAAAECRLTYDDRALYVACRCLDPDPRRIRAHLTDRDGIWRNDYVGVILDTFNDQRRAYLFFVNPLGVQGDGLRNEVAAEGDDDFSWDAIWDSAARITAEGYQVEMAIPFRALRFPPGGGAQSWGVAFRRVYPRTVQHDIASVPLDRSNACLLCQLARLEGLEGINPGHDLELVPSATARRTDTSRADGGASPRLQRGQVATEAGISARWGVSPGLSLHAALNPDFSQVEADAAELEENTRFALFYPEKRPFFLEGSDVLATPITAVYTRAVADPTWGLRTTGKAGAQVFSAFVARDRLLNLLFPSREDSEYGSWALPNTAAALRYRRDVGEASAVGLLATSRTAAGYHNHLAGLDGMFRLSPSDTVTVHVLRSATRYPAAVAEEQGQPAGAFAGTAWQVEYTRQRRHLSVWAWYHSLAPAFRADLGYVPQVDTRGGEVGVERIFWGRPGALLTRASVGVEVEREEDFAGRLGEKAAEVSAHLEGPYQSRLTLQGERFREAYAGTLYAGTRSRLSFTIRPSGQVTASLGARWGDAVDYTNGRPARQVRLTPGLTLNLGRHLSLEAHHQWERLAVSEGRLYSAHLTQARLVYQFTANTFARLVLQYLDVARNAALYRAPVSAHRTRLRTQLLFSYKLNPHTVAFLGYADHRAGEEHLDRLPGNRTFFLKVSYAWQL